MAQEPRTAIDVRSWVRSERTIPPRVPPRVPPWAVAVSVLAAVALVVGLVLVLADPFADAPERSGALPAGVPEPRATTPSTRPAAPAVPPVTAPAPATSGASESEPGATVTPIPESENPLTGLVPDAAVAARARARTVGAVAQEVQVDVPCVAPALQGCDAPERSAGPVGGAGPAVGALLGLGAAGVAWWVRRATTSA